MNVLISISHSLCKESFKLRSHKNTTSGTIIDRFSERSYTHSILKSSLLPQKLVWKEKHELFARMEREGYQIKVAA